MELSALQEGEGDPGFRGSWEDAVWWPCADDHAGETSMPVLR